MSDSTSSRVSRGNNRKTGVSSVGIDNRFFLCCGSCITRACMCGPYLSCAAAGPLQFVAFDVLAVNGKDVRNLATPSASEYSQGVDPA